MKYAIGIDLGGTNLKIGLVNKNGKVIGDKKFPTKGYKGPKPLIDKIVLETEKLIRSAKIDSDDICGIGVGVPGIVDSINGIIYNLTNISGWKNVCLKKELEKRTKLKAYVDNDVNMMAVGELYYGAAKGGKNVVCITLGTGVGGGIIIDGKLYRGSSLAAGEIGHITLYEKGPKCNCGNHGCLEVFVGNQRIIAHAIGGIESGAETSIMKLARGDLKKITPEIISAAALKGDKFAIDVWKRVGECLGIVFAGIINFLNPDMIVIGGGIAKAGDVMFSEMRKTIRKRAFKISVDKARIVQAKLGYNAGIIGAATLPMVEENVL